MKAAPLFPIFALAIALPSRAQQNDRRDDHRPPQVPPLVAFFDTDRDGVLSKEEIRNAAKALGKLDHDRNGEITAEEARPPAPPPREIPPPPPVIATLDADRNGTISAEEMANAPVSLKTLDKNGDGELSPEEQHPPGPPPPGDRRDGPQGPPPEETGGGDPLDAE